MFTHKIWIIILFVCASFRLQAQVLSMDDLKRLANGPRLAKITQFYQLNQGHLAWVGDTARQNEFLALLQQAPLVGLEASAYQEAFFRQYKPGTTLKSRDDSIATDVLFTDAALHFFSDVKGGAIVPTLRYQGLAYSPDLSGIVPGLKKHLETGRLQEFFLSLQPRSREYTNALEKLRWLLQVQTQAFAAEPKVSSTVADSTNRPLLIRLYQLGITDTVDPAISRTKLKTCILAAQAQFDLVSDGKLGPATLKTLNTPLQQRIDALKRLLQTLRWLEYIKQTGSVLLLNIPSANLLVYENGSIVLDSKVIVGKSSTPTPTLSSTITEVILYPYWNVTHNIATKEMLPRIKRDIGYLERGNYQVLNNNGTVLNPYSINWHALSRGYFPYRIRQSTGCDNALGIVKFNFYNPFTVYLHDTPTKTLFASNRRFFSHGCMRVEKPVELARFLLGFNRIAIDTLTAKGCLTSEAPKTVKVEKPLPVLILYNTVWYRRDGSLRFYDDIYNRFPHTPVKTVAQHAQPATAVPANNTISFLHKNQGYAKRKLCRKDCFESGAVGQH